MIVLLNVQVSSDDFIQLEEKTHQGDFLSPVGPAPNRPRVLSPPGDPPIPYSGIRFDASATCVRKSGLGTQHATPAAPPSHMYPAFVKGLGRPIPRSRTWAKDFI